MPKGVPSVPVAIRFWRNVSAPDERGCMRWGGYHNPQTGYGQVSMPKREAARFGARIVTAPVVACTLAHGWRPEGMTVLHSCDNRGCCAPQHLRWGTPKENSREAWDRGRQKWGEEHHQAKLADAEVLEVIRRVRAGESAYSVAKQVGMCNSTVCRWVKGHGRGRLAS